LGLFRIYDGKVDFNAKWVHLIRGCCESSTVSVLVNGSPTMEFKLKKGLSQRDPLVPFLLLVAVEGLSSAFKEVEKKKAL